MSKYTITITREFGSLGRPIAHALSQKLGIEYYEFSYWQQKYRKRF